MLKHKQARNPRKAVSSCLHMAPHVADLQGHQLGTRSRQEPKKAHRRQSPLHTLSAVLLKHPFKPLLWSSCAFWEAHVAGVHKCKCTSSRCARSPLRGIISDAPSNTYTSEFISYLLRLFPTLNHTSFCSFLYTHRIRTHQHSPSAGGEEKSFT